MNQNNPVSLPAALRLPALLLAGILLAGCAAPATPTPSPAVRLTSTPAASRTPPPQPTARQEPTSGQPTVTAHPSDPNIDPQVAAVLAGIDSQQVTAYMQEFTGKTPLSLGDSPGMIESRNDEENLSEITLALYQFLQGHGYSVRYQDWYDAEQEVGGRNVIGELPGETRPQEIVILSAHVDSYCEESRCPGADDNASGAVGVLMAAEHLSGMRFERTLRFVFFTGEEIDLLGSYYYAEELKASGEHVVAVINLDMIAWDGNGDGTALLYAHACGTQACAEDAAVAEAVTQAVHSYAIRDFQPFISAGDYADSDAYSFWEAGFPAILAIEDDQAEENPYYHTGEDTLETLDVDYLTAYIQAATAAAAGLAGPVKP
jgi:hypothetical protein